MTTIWLSFKYYLQQFTVLNNFANSTKRFSNWLNYIAWFLLAIGIFSGLAIAPIDFRQGNSFRIIYIHVPSAILSLSIYVMMAIASFIFFMWRIQLAVFFARAAANYGALMTTLALISGSIWGKPTWGTYWTWDARLTSELILLFLYLAYILLYNSFDDEQQANIISSILAIVGVINIPIIHFSVVWWRSIHQGATIFKIGAPSISISMLWPLILCLLAFYLLFFSYIIKQINNLIIQVEIKKILQD